MATKERNEYREGPDGKVTVWRVVEHDAEGAGGAWPIGEMTLQGAATALAELYPQFTASAENTRQIAERIDEIEEVKARMFERERAGVDPLRDRGLAAAATLKPVRQSNP